MNFNPEKNDLKHQKSLIPDEISTQFPLKFSNKHIKSRVHIIKNIIGIWNNRDNEIPGNYTGVMGCRGLPCFTPLRELKKSVYPSILALDFHPFSPSFPLIIYPPVLEILS